LLVYFLLWLYHPRKATHVLSSESTEKAKSSDESGDNETTPSKERKKDSIVAALRKRIEAINAAP